MKIPIFTSQLEKSREATDAANIRAAYAEVAVAVLDESLDGTTDHTTLPLSGGLTATRANSSGSYTVTVNGTGFKVHQTVANWQTAVTVAGYAIPTATNMVGANSIIFTFTQPTTGNDYLSTITFGAPTA